ncbi:lipopolysaccharide biosynthesis protein RfbH [Candidatus Pacearchaeota archaeon]|jgi:CDP-6-deoxy-D-xylo-4-hexulose-3-dehydrase|nr:lipopolysaccharide biosynthesis protein RfbH [Candidatus Pacearchaeota archaeon]|tara:strand:- start:1244 stop:2584 length:1341 start_codon:yes stop_codon:yes gene_type:complete
MEENTYNENLEKIKELIRQIYEQRKKSEEFIPGKSKVHYSGPIFDEKEVNATIANLTAGTWLAEGKATLEFEKQFSDLMRVKDTIVTNSGSSALLLIFACLMNKDLENPLKEGDEVITSALMFPTTLNSIILNRLKPVFVDVEPETYNLDINQIEQIISEKTRAILVMHHLGNPCDMNRIVDIAKKHNLYVIEDCCDAHGAMLGDKILGSFGHMAAYSFYGAHAMTMGEGGAIVVNDLKFSPLLISLKTCGRACTCAFCNVAVDPDFQCPQRFESKYAGFENFDKRTLYPNIGYKLKILDLQCAFGIEQLKRLPDFVKKRQGNFDSLMNGLKKFEKYLTLPKVLEGSKPSWFAIPITLKSDCGFSREELVDYLEKNNIETRPLLGGNLAKQPAYQEIDFKSSPLPHTDYCHVNSFYIGCYPGITQEMINFVLNVFEDFFRKLENSQ